MQPIKCYCSTLLSPNSIISIQQHEHNKIRVLFQPFLKQRNQRKYHKALLHQHWHSQISTWRHIATFFIQKLLIPMKIMNQENKRKSSKHLKAAATSFQCESWLSKILEESRFTQLCSYKANKLSLKTPCREYIVDKKFIRQISDPILGLFYFDPAYTLNMKLQ